MSVMVALEALDVELVVERRHLEARPALLLERAEVDAGAGGAREAARVGRDRVGDDRRRR